MHEIKEDEGLKWESRAEVWVSKTCLGCGGPRTERSKVGSSVLQTQKRGMNTKTQDQELVAIKMGESVT